jgi:hypothetical protein
MGHNTSALDLLEEFFDADPDQFDTTKPWSHDDRAWPSADLSWGTILAAAIGLAS